MLNRIKENMRSCLYLYMNKYIYYTENNFTIDTLNILKNNPLKRLISDFNFCSLFISYDIRYNSKQ